MKVAVIGAGVAGLIASRELQRAGHRVVVFEKKDQLGGTWIYDSRVEADPLSLDPNREVVISSLYFSLRTNLPRHLMGFSDYPFGVTENGDSRNFPGHEEVLRFLNDFARDFGLGELIRFGAEVVRVERIDSGKHQWVVESRTSEVSSEEFFEAVVVCNGHHTEPRVPILPGIEKWPGRQVHSHNYRHPEPYQNQVVVMIGNGPSAFDISREIATVAKEVHLSSRSPDVKVSRLGNHHNIWQHSKIVCVREDGTITFQDASSVHADTIFHCTGYKYNFPFLRTNGIVTVDDNRVGPLYKDVFPPKLAPSLSFVGIPNRGLVFPLMELQSKWIASALSGKLLLPSVEEMLAEVEAHYKQMEENGIPKYHTHVLDPIGFEYQDWLSAQVGLPPLDKRLKDMFWQLIMCVISQKDGYRDEMDIDNMMRSVT
ncbi:Flavin-containing monooxygenase FMO GS-OX-like [Actinidia chinensis var. chinensis]|uniref:Flavin-containing monooxygenase n=1 Tax=Actinidia chinensis var. chinensis TaxID=1590841 RepID=A0A2R6R9A5_ACTCC|nr:Flavin-containing monooxygenase FMO GS-OX-like [Actinidia chinensis var. chinensis]